MQIRFRQRPRSARRPLGSFKPQIMTLEDRLPPGSLLSVGGLGLLTTLASDSDATTPASGTTLGSPASLTLAAAVTQGLDDSSQLGLAAASAASATPAGSVSTVTNTPLVLSFGVPADWLSAHPTPSTTASSSPALAAAFTSASSASLVAAPQTGTGAVLSTTPVATSPAPQQSPVVPSSVPATSAAAPISQAQAQQQLSHLALSFEANQGQYNAPIQFTTRAENYTLFVLPGEAVYGLQGPSASPDSPVPGETGGRKVPGMIRAERNVPATTDAALVHMQLLGANLSAPVIGQQELPGKVNYYFGNDPNLWFSNIATFGQIVEQGVYPGIDLVYYGNQNRDVEYDLNVAAGANPGAIRLGFSGATMSLDDQGNLVLSTDVGQLVQHRPVAYQMVNGVRQQVTASFVLQDQGQVSFRLGTYDATQPLVIDPGSQFSTYIGGSNTDRVFGAGVDGAGNAYITGHTKSTNFPTTAGAFMTRYPPGSGFASFVSKLDPTGSTLLYSTYLGGNINDQASGIAVDAAGNAVVVGVANSANFPTTPGAFQTRLGGGGTATNCFLSKFDPTGGLTWSSFLGGSVDDEGYSALPGPGVGLDNAGNVYITGYSASPDFPVTASAYQRTLRSGSTGNNAFLSKLSADGSTLMYSTYLGGSQDFFSHGAADGGSGVGVVGSVAYILGTTNAMDFPVTPGAFETTGNGGGTASAPNDDLFVAAIDTSQSGVASLVYSTYIGGSGEDASNGIAVDSAGNSYITGITDSVDYPVTAGAFQTTNQKVTAGSEYAFVTKVAPDGSHLVFSSYYGGTMDSDGIGEQGNAIAVDTAGNVYVNGSTSSFDLPISPNAIQGTYGGGRDAFLAKFSGDGSTLIYGTYFGGPALEAGLAITTYLDSTGNTFVYAGGSTGSSTGFLTSAAAFQRIYGGGDRDGWLVRARSPM